MTNTTYRWIIVAAGGLIGCVAMGAMFSLPVMLLAVSKATGWGMTGISAAMTIGFLAMAVGGMAWGSLSDRIGPRPVLLIGGAALAGSLFIASRSSSLLAFQLAFGLGVGGAVSAVFAPVMACVTGWFDTHRSLAVSLASAGIGMAPMTMSPLAARLIATHDWRTTMALIAAIAAAVMIPTAFLVRRPPALDGQPADGEAAALIPGDRAGMTAGQVLRSPQFLVLLATNFFCCATHSGPIIHTVSYAVTCGIPLVAAVSIYSLEGLAGLGGRIAFGALGDRFGAKRVLVTGLLAQSLGTLGYVAAGNLAGFYAAAAAFGFIYAGVMPLYAAIARENFPLKMMGMVIGGISMGGSLGMATGPVAGGLIYDATGSYRWLYFGSCAMGLGAFLIAMTFRPMAKPGGAAALAGTPA